MMDRGKKKGEFIHMGCTCKHICLVQTSTGDIGWRKAFKTNNDEYSFFKKRLIYYQLRCFMLVTEKPTPIFSIYSSTPDF